MDNGSFKILFKDGKTWAGNCNWMVFQVMVTKCLTKGNVAKVEFDFTTKEEVKSGK